MNIVNKAFKFRIYPTGEQATLIQKTFGCTRYIFNRKLDAIQKEYDAYKENGGVKPKIDTKYTPFLSDETEWLREVDSNALQYACRDVKDAYTRFFRGQNKHPNFKSKKSPQRSYSTKPSSVDAKPDTWRKIVDVENHTIKINKIGRVRAKLHRSLDSIVRIYGMTVSQTASGGYYVSLKTETVVEKRAKTGRSVGIDLGLSHLVITSDGQKYENQVFLKKSERKLAREQRRLSKMQRGSNNYAKQRLRVAKIHERITRQRDHVLHCITKDLVTNYDFIALETLRSTNLMKNDRLSKAIADASWFKFATFLHYKADWYGSEVVKIDPWFASSQICSHCGHHGGKKPLYIRTWTCPVCGEKLDRDVNAAENILKKGKETFAEICPV